MSLGAWANHLIRKALLALRHRHNNTICLRPRDLVTTPAVSTSDLPKGILSPSCSINCGGSWPFIYMFFVFFWICVVNFNNLWLYNFLLMIFFFLVLYLDIMFFCCYRRNNSINFVCLFNFWSGPMSFRCNMDMTFRKMEHTRSHSGVDIALDSESKGRGFDSHCDRPHSFWFFFLMILWHCDIYLSACLYVICIMILEYLLEWKIEGLY